MSPLPGLADSLLRHHERALRRLREEEEEIAREARVCFLFHLTQQMHFGERNVFCSFFCLFFSLGEAEIRIS
jgi:hypothetical protein